MRRFISVKDIDVNGSPHVRGEYRMEVAEEYSEFYKQKKHGMPDPVLFKVVDKLFVGDGMHRIAAMEIAKATTQTFEVIDGTWHDCVKFALRSNVANGIRRSNSDKRACAILAVKEFPSLSNVLLADSCAVGDDLIGEVRKEMEDKKLIPRLEKRTGADGRSMPSTKKGIGEAEDKMEKTKGVSGLGKDATGYPLTEKSSIYWDRIQEIVDLRDHVSAIKRSIAIAMKEEDPLFSEFNFSAFEADIDRIDKNLSLAMPYSVCPKCQGNVVEMCRLCSGRGVISKFKFDTGVSEELKNIRKASIK